jgi:plasmid maintenance system antidote protein VapI
LTKKYLHGITPAMLKDAIARKGLKQSWLADQLCVTDARMSRWVRGTHPVPLEYVIPLGRLLDLSPDQIRSGMTERDREALHLTDSNHASV